MSINRRNAKRDANEKEIVAALQQVGALVYRISAKDIADLLVLFRGETLLLEVKMPKGAVKPGQTDFIETWNEHGGTAVIVRSVDEALAAIGVVSEVQP